jgi:hypothetical protein
MILPYYLRSHRYHDVLHRVDELPQSAILIWNYRNESMYYMYNTWLYRKICYNGNVYLDRIRYKDNRA